MLNRAASPSRFSDISTNKTIDPLSFGDSLIFRLKSGSKA